MKLSQLAYQCVKNVYYTSDISFKYDLFKVGGYNTDSEFDLEISNVFSPINEAISRLNNLNKIPHIFENAVLDSDKTALIPSSMVSVIGVGKVKPFQQFAFTEFGNKVRVDTYQLTVCLEGKRKIPYFLAEGSPLEKNSYHYNAPIADQTSENLIEEEEYDVDLFEEYGITDEMCAYIIEYVAGRLWEVTDVKIANMHRTIAEHYFLDLPDKEILFTQKSIDNFYKIGQ